MKIRSVICNKGPASQLAYVNQFISLFAGEWSEAYLSLNRSAMANLGHSGTISGIHSNETCSSLTLLSALSLTAQRHRIAAIGNEHCLFRSNTSVRVFRADLRNCAVQTSQSKDGQQDFHFPIHWGRVSFYTHLRVRSICLKGP